MLIDCILEGEVLVADKFAPILRKAAFSLPRSSSCSLPPAEKLDILQKNQILQSFEKNETPRVNLTTTADLLNKYSRRREKLYAQQMGTKVKEEEVERQDKEEMETVKQMKPPERWKRLEAILETVEQKRRLVNESWKIQCRYPLTFFYLLLSFQLNFLPSLSPLTYPLC